MCLERGNEEASSDCVREREVYEADPTGLANILAQLTCQTLPNMCTGDPHLISGGVRDSAEGIFISVPAVPHKEPVGRVLRFSTCFAMESEPLFNRAGALYFCTL